jgi:hypothetical protein
MKLKNFSVNGEENFANCEKPGVKAGGAFGTVCLK